VIKELKVELAGFDEVELELSGDRRSLEEEPDVETKLELVG
jgi:hypothetical protein